MAGPFQRLLLRRRRRRLCFQSHRRHHRRHTRHRRRLRRRRCSGSRVFLTRLRLGLCLQAERLTPGRGTEWRCHDCRGIWQRLLSIGNNDFHLAMPPKSRILTHGCPFHHATAQHGCCCRQNRSHPALSQHPQHPCSVQLAIEWSSRNTLRFRGPIVDENEPLITLRFADSGAVMGRLLREKNLKASAPLIVVRDPPGILKLHECKGWRPGWKLQVNVANAAVLHSERKRSAVK